MPAGSQISGEDGIIMLLDTGDVEIGEIPCLESWTINAAAALAERGTKCMKSNDDGGSDSTGAWVNQTVSGKSWDVSLGFFWQESQSIPASVQLDATNVGDTLKLKLYPNNDTTGKVMYSGTAIIESVSTPSEVNGDVKVTVGLKGTGALVKSTVA